MNKPSLSELYGHLKMTPQKEEENNKVKQIEIKSFMNKLNVKLPEAHMRIINNNMVDNDGKHKLDQKSKDYVYNWDANFKNGTNLVYFSSSTNAGKSFDATWVLHQLALFEINMNPQTDFNCEWITPNQIIRLEKSNIAAFNDLLCRKIICIDEMDKIPQYRRDNNDPGRGVIQEVVEYRKHILVRPTIYTMNFETADQMVEHLSPYMTSRITGNAIKVKKEINK